MKFFNIAGPCDERFHYMIPAAARLPEASKLVARGEYFAVHAPRQTGKSTTLRAIARELTASGRYAALYVSCEMMPREHQPRAEVVRLLLELLAYEARSELPEDCWPPAWPSSTEDVAVYRALAAWASIAARPLVLFIDEIDVLFGDALISVLSQLRAGHPNRPDRAPWSVAICGLRDVRDYKAASGGNAATLGSTSPFNIKTHSLRLGDFTRDEVAALYAQHTAETGQVFVGEAIERVIELTSGQPWLVNAIARQIIDGMDIGDVITAAHVERAAQQLIVRRDTHIDSLLARLREPRVRRVLEPLLAGTLANPDEDDVQFARDLGLIALDAPLRPANAIYAEVIARALAVDIEHQIRLPGPRPFVDADGRLLLRPLLEAFAAWWTQHAEAIAAPADYHEAAPQLVLMAFLQRVVNGGGFIDREYGIGRGAIDLLVRWPLPDGNWQREGIELKVWPDKKRDPRDAGLAQLDRYLARVGLDHGALIVFDRRADAAPIEDRVLFEDAATPTGRPVIVLRA
ncbi:MAG: AAA-like domain-containing protein [Myxococcales bacterium]|nr:AAA-like domain-containing protein [Myxococcales bacterium]